MKKTVLFILSALLLGACAPRTTTQPAEAPKPQQDRYSVKSMIEAFLAPVLEGNIDYMLADENRKCYGIIEGDGANSFRLRQLLADPQKRDTILDELRKSAQDVKSRIYGIEIGEDEIVQSAPPRPNTTYTVWLYARVDSFPENRSFMIGTKLDGPRARLCAVKDFLYTGLIDLYLPYIISIVDKYGQ